MLFQSTLLHEERLRMILVVAVFGDISIHAPTWGATLALVLARHNLFDFNPRSYMRSDYKWLASGITTMDFNPRSYMRSDVNRGAYDVAGGWFQSTLLHEERRHLWHRCYCLCQHFNPRSYMRSDDTLPLTSLGCYRISIHAPTWGATSKSVEGWECWLISIHAPTWGATIYSATPENRKMISIHAPTWGATDLNAPSKYFFLISIHAPTWGATL